MRWTPVISLSPCGPYFRNRRSVFDRRVAFRGRLIVEHLEALNVAFVLQDSRDLGLQPRRGHVDARVLGGHRVADPREHVCDWIGHISLNLHGNFGELVIWCSW